MPACGRSSSGPRSASVTTSRSHSERGPRMPQSSGPNGRPGRNRWSMMLRTKRLRHRTPPKSRRKAPLRRNPEMHPTATPIRNRRSPKTPGTRGHPPKAPRPELRPESTGGPDFSCREFSIFCSSPFPGSYRPFWPPGFWRRRSKDCWQTLSRRYWATPPRSRVGMFFFPGLCSGEHLGTGSSAGLNPTDPAAIFPHL